MCIEICIDVCTDMCIDTCADMCIDICADMCIDMCIHMCPSNPWLCCRVCVCVQKELCHVRRACGHVCRDADGRVCLKRISTPPT